MAACYLTDRVPAEVRNRIYECISEDVRSRSDPCPALMCGKGLIRGALNDYIGLCQVTKQIRAEFTPLLFHQCHVYVGLEDAVSLFTTILAPWSTLPLFRPGTDVALGGGSVCAPTAGMIIIMEGNKNRKPVTHNFPPIFQARIKYPSMAFIFAEWAGYVQQLSHYLNIDVMWSMPTEFTNAINTNRFSDITF